MLDQVVSTTTTIMSSVQKLGQSPGLTITVTCWLLPVTINREKCSAVHNAIHKGGIWVTLYTAGVITSSPGNLAEIYYGNHYTFKAG